MSASLIIKGAALEGGYLIGEAIYQILRYRITAWWGLYDVHFGLTIDITFDIEIIPSKLNPKLRNLLCQDPPMAGLKSQARAFG